MYQETLIFVNDSFTSRLRPIPRNERAIDRKRGSIVQFGPLACNVQRFSTNGVPAGPQRDDAGCVGVKHSIEIYIHVSIKRYSSR